MKKIISIAILALVCNIAFAQTNIDAIYDKTESLINTGNSYYDDFKQFQTTSNNMKQLQTI